MTTTALFRVTWEVVERHSTLLTAEQVAQLADSPDDLAGWEGDESYQDTLSRDQISVDSIRTVACYACRTGDPTECTTCQGAGVLPHTGTTVAQLAVVDAGGTVSCPTPQAPNDVAAANPLAGLADQFSADEIECLLVTLADLYDGSMSPQRSTPDDPEDLSQRQRELADRLSVAATARWYEAPAQANPEA